MAYDKSILEKEMSQEEANKVLSEIVNQFNSDLGLAEDFANKHSLSFSIEPTYGMGGLFTGGKPALDEDGEAVKNYYGDQVNENGETLGWMASSQSC